MSRKSQEVLISQTVNPFKKRQKVQTGKAQEEQLWDFPSGSDGKEYTCSVGDPV